MADVLTAEQRKFVQVYDGDEERVAKALEVPVKTVRSWLKIAAVRDGIRARTGKSVVKNEIATREDRMKFWTEMMTDEMLPQDTRLKASELLAKAECDFSERHIHEGPNGGPVLGVTVHVPIGDLEQRTRDILARKLQPEALPAAKPDDAEFLD